jgi:hypothetical protein
MKKVADLGLTGAIRSTWSQRTWTAANLWPGNGFTKTAEAISVRGPGHAPGQMATAPDAGFPPGKIDFTFKLRAGELRGPPGNVLAKIEFYDHRTGKTLATHDVHGSDLPHAQWSDLHVPLDVPAERNLISVRVNWTGAGDFDVGGISAR